MATQVLEREQLRTDGGTQQRVKISEEVVREYAEALLAGKSLPPPVAFFDGESYWLADGFLRALAHKAAQRDEIEVDVHMGTQRDAVLYSCGANAEHGQPRTNDDKRQAVTVLVTDKEWSQWSDRRIAEAAGVSFWLVADVRRQLQESCSSTGDGETVIDTPPQPQKRIGKDGKARAWEPKRKVPPPEPSANGVHDSPKAEPVKPSPKSGQPVFDDRTITDLIGKLTRAVNERSKVRGKSPLFHELWSHLDAALKSWNRWQQEQEVAS